jgi:hypothetical protein
MREVRRPEEGHGAARIVGLTALILAAIGILATLFVRDQISRQRRNLFNSFTLRRVAALEHVARQKPTVDHINLLRDYLAWEPRKLLRNRARAIVERMEREALERVGSVEGALG